MGACQRRPVAPAYYRDRRRSLVAYRRAAATGGGGPHITADSLITVMADDFPGNGRLRQIRT